MTEQLQVKEQREVTIAVEARTIEMGRLSAAALALRFAGVLSVEVAQHRLQHLQDGGGGHDAHADHRHLVENDGVVRRRVPGQLLGSVGEMKRVGS